MSPAFGSISPLRTRLVIGFCAAMAIVLIGAGTFLYWRVEYALDRGLDRDLKAGTTQLAKGVDADGTVDRGSRVHGFGLVWQVVDTNGKVTDHDESAPTTPLLTEANLRHLGSDSGVYRTGTLLQVSPVPLRVRVTPIAHHRRLLVGARTNRRDEALRELLVQMLVAGIGALALAAIVGGRLTKAALAPVERYRAQTASIAAGATGVRLDVPVADDEVGRLGRTLNAMLDALEATSEAERRFIAEASHELRTPLSLLLARIQLARRRTRTASEYESAFDELGIDVERLVRLADQLLTLRQSGKGVAGSCNAVAAVGDLVRRLDEVTPDADLRLAISSPDAPVAVPTSTVESIATNLIQNAQRHGTAPIHITLDVVGGCVRLMVVDSGPGMPPDLLATATNFFTRAPEARATPGSGLGLALVASLVTEAGGELRLCHDGHHEHVGEPCPVACEHGSAMAATVLLPTDA